MGAAAPSANEPSFLWSLPEAVEALNDWDIGPMRAWLEAELGDLIEQIPDRLADLESASWWNSDGKAAALSEMALDILLRARARPAVLGPLILYLRHVGMSAWEESWVVEGIHLLAENVTRWMDQSLDDLGADQADVRAAAQLLEFLSVEMGVFAAGVVGNLHDWAESAAEASRVAKTYLQRISADARGACVHYARRCFELEVVYYECVAEAASAAASFSAGATVAAAPLDVAIDRISGCRGGLDRADSSELRAHGASLRGLRSALGAEWLLVRKGRISLVFSFGLGGVRDKEVVDRARQNGMSWTLAGLPVVSLSASLPISDVWNSSDPLNRAYSGAAMRLPEIDLQGPDGGLRQRYRPSIWLSELGNHLLRLDFAVEDVGPVELFECVRAASPEHYGLRNAGFRLQSMAPEFRSEDWDSLAQFVTRCVADLGRELSAPGFVPNAHFAPQSFLALAALDQVASWCPATGAIRPVMDPADVLKLYGSQILTTTLWADLASVAQWAQVVPSPDSIVVPSMGGVRASVTANTGVLVGLGIPSYTVDLLADCIVFGASVDGLFGSWYADLARLNRQNEVSLGDVEPRLESQEHPLTSEDVQRLAMELERSQLRVHDFVLRCRSTMLFIESSTLVQLHTFRAFLDEVLRVMRFRERRESFLASADSMTQSTLESIVERVKARIAQQEMAVQRKRDRRVRLAIDALLSGVAVAGLSGLASLVQAGYQLGAVPTGLIVATVVLVSIVIALAVWSASRRES